VIITIGKLKIGRGKPVRFIADIGANHDGDLGRAKGLIELARDSGADIVKFQNFRADSIVSDYGFKMLGKTAHQLSWQESVYKVYEDASLPFEWIPLLKEHCDSVGVEFMSTPYDYVAVDALAPYVNAFKIGSGDINWRDFIRYVALKKKPVIISCGATYEHEVGLAITWIRDFTPEVVLLQCNTNYTGDPENYKYSNLRAMRSMGDNFRIEVGLSDHTWGMTTIQGAVTLGACLIERHFTDDNGRIGPDHAFALEPVGWREMVESVRKLEQALGDGQKEVEENERESRIVQRRCLRANRKLFVGDIIVRDAVSILRPAPLNSIEPNRLQEILNRPVIRDIEAGEHFTWGNNVG